MKNKGLEIVKTTEVASTLLARDYKGFGNQEATAIVELKRGYSVNVKDEKEKTEGIDVIGNYSKSNYVQTSIVGKNGVAPTITENHGQVTAIAIKNNTKQGYLLAEDGDGVDISGRMEHHRGTVQKGLSQTITTRGGNNIGVVVKDTENYIEWKEKGKLDVDCRAWKEDKIAPTTTTTTNKTKILLNNLRIRKLTPFECGSLMGVKYEDKINMSKNKTDSVMYHLYGDSIITSILMSVIGQLLGIDYEEKINEVVEDISTKKG